jgi:hypothetical protein
MNKKNLREARRAKIKKKKLVSTLIWSGAAVSIVALFSFVIWRAVQPAAGETIPVMANSADHVLEGDDPGPYNSDPPTSGPHYAEEYDAGFYDESSPEVQVPFPEGYLGHNLEHGYVIYWYNCGSLDGSECTALKDQIKDSMADNGGTKLIAFPRSSLEVPVVMTTWGQMQRFENFDEGLARKFVSANRNQAPEPNAP